MSDHDGIYRRLFSQPRLVEDLLRRFVGGNWIERLDFDTLELVPAHYVSEDLEHREQDLVWRVKIRPHPSQPTTENHWFYVYILLELQSTVDRFMVLRLAVYLGLLYQDLVKRRDLTPDGLLPPALPIVLYNGQEPWWAPLEMDALVDTSIPELADFRLRMSYRVFDEIHIEPHELPEGPVAAIFEIERSRTPKELDHGLKKLIHELDESDLATLKLDVATWILRIIEPDRFHDHRIQLPNEFGDLKNMLAERVKEWEKELLAQGEDRGMEKGERIGREQGRTDGLRSALLKQFQLKFGEPPADHLRRRIETTGPDDLERWLERILDAESPDEIFDHSEAAAT